MRIGIIAEGHADRAVIENILSGLTGLDTSSFVALRPSDLVDETDKAKLAPASFGSWTNVRTECQTRQLIDPFLMLHEQEFIAIHMDSAEAHLYGVNKPDPKSAAYCADLRALVVAQINAWLDLDYSESILYAVAIEEIDAWILTLHENQDSAKFLDAKRRLGRVLSRKNINSTSNYTNYGLLTREFSRTKIYRTSTIVDRNCSLAAFCQEVVDKVLPKLPQEAAEAPTIVK